MCLRSIGKLAWKDVSIASEGNAAIPGFRSIKAGRRDVFVSNETAPIDRGISISRENFNELVSARLIHRYHCDDSGNR